MPYHNVHEVTSAFPEEDHVVIDASWGSHWRWDLEDDARRIDLELPSNANCVSVSPNGPYAAWGLVTGEIYIWDADKDAGQMVEGHSSSVECMAFSSDSETLVSGSTDIWEWSPQAAPEKLCQVGTIIIKCIAISPNGKFVVFRSDTLLVFHCTTHEVEQIM
ncbi:TolB, C-terminal domain-containing protein [Piedraia hortae CBS 480.64]|uniref:Pre-rRNA-processing protein IPI3 n=1 Tax=Piedraia hortae CBS 480.64 TaxID=1314780 RepID=A0A6A7BNX7_9PEZI|nr:TolB, C-terminal domain-containing protein [Piedraia hortae CBS 480.64]